MLNVSLEPGYKLLITLPLPRKHELRTVYRQGIPRPPRCYPVHALPLGGVKIIAGNFSLRTGCNGPLRQKVLANFPLCNDLPPLGIFILATPSLCHFYTRSISKIASHFPLLPNIVYIY